MPGFSPSPVILRGPVFTTPGQGPDLVNPAGPLIGGASPSSLAVAASTPLMNLPRQPVQGCAVSPAAAGGMAVDVTGGLVAYDQTNVSGAGATSLAVAAADPAQDRYDAVVVDKTGTVSVLTGVAGQPWAPVPSDAAQVVLAVLYVPAGASTPTVYDSRINPQQIPQIQTPQLEVANTMSYSYLSSALSAADPGAGNMGFDVSNLGAWGNIAHLYLNYFNPTWPYLTGLYKTLKAWLQPFGDPAVNPYYMVVWSRKSPNQIGVLKVTSFTDHATWADLGVTGITFTGTDSGPAAAWPNLSTDPADTILERIGAVPPAAVTTWTIKNKTALTSRASTVTLAADPDLQFAAAANTTYIVRGTIRYDGTSTTPGFKFDLDGPTSPTRVLISWWDASPAGTPAFLALETAFNTAHTLTTATGSNPGIVHFDAIIENGANTGTISFRWCQNTSNVSPVIVREGSYLEYLVS